MTAPRTSPGGAFVLTLAEERDGRTWPYRRLRACDRALSIAFAAPSRPTWRVGGTTATHESGRPPVAGGFRG